MASPQKFNGSGTNPRAESNSNGCCVHFNINQNGLRFLIPEGIPSGLAYGMGDLISGKKNSKVRGVCQTYLLKLFGKNAISDGKKK